MGEFGTEKSVIKYKALCLTCIEKWAVVFLRRSVYQECMGKELSKRGIPFVERQELRFSYKGETLRQTYIPDFICHEFIIVELKALSVTTGVHKAQVLNYLKATGIRLGLLVSFGCYPKATIERIVL